MKNESRITSGPQQPLLRRSVIKASLGFVSGAILGLILGDLWGSPALGLICGAGIGLISGAALDRRDRRSLEGAQPSRRHRLEPEKTSLLSARSLTFFTLAAGLLSLFVARTLLAARFPLPRMNDLFTAIALAGSLVILLSRYDRITTLDWLIALGAGLFVGVTMYFATLFDPYDFWGIVRSNAGQALVRGAAVVIAMLGGLAAMHEGGPVQVSLAQGDYRKTFMSLLIGLAIGAPLAILNVFALQLTQGHPISWQSPLAALSDAFQPAIVEEVVYRFALLGLLWMLLRRSMPGSAGWLAGLLALLAHNFMHFDDLWLQAPLTALGMGLVMALVWGLPPTILALRRDLESAVAFHWIQDAARFLAGF